MLDGGLTRKYMQIAATGPPTAMNGFLRPIDVLALSLMKPTAKPTRKSIHLDSVLTTEREPTSMPYASVYTRPVRSLAMSEKLKAALRGA